MEPEALHPAVARVVRDHDAGGALDLLGERLTGADLTALLLEVASRRARAITASDVLAQYRRDRFVAPAAVESARLFELRRLAREVLSADFELVDTSPVVPLGTHSVIAGVDQNRVVSTVRSTEVAADPTTSLALEAAVRRRSLLDADPRSSEPVHLASSCRVLRAQRFDGPRAFTHFELLGLVSAGRDTGGRTFERTSIRLQLTTLAALARRAGFPEVVIRLSDFSGDFGEVVDELLSTDWPGSVTVEAWPERTAAVGYYPSVCFKLDVVTGDEQVELADGGIVDWTQSLLGNRKERLVIAGLSLERLATL